MQPHPVSVSALIGYFDYQLPPSPIPIDGMNAEFNVEKCPEPDVRHVKLDSEEMSHEDYASMFNTVNLLPPFQVRSSREQSKTWKHFIAAEEILWDYTPHLKPTDR